MIQFDVNTRIGKLRYRASMDRQMAIFERRYFWRLKKYIKSDYRQIARQIRETGDLRFEHIIEKDMDLFIIMMDMFHRTSVHYSEMFAEAADETRGKALVDVFWEFYRNFAKMYVANRVVAINRTTKKRIRKIIERGLEEELTTRQIATNINQVSEVESRMRAQRIATTEIHTISNLTQEKMAVAEPLVTEKEWLSAVDERVRAWHFTGGGVFSESGQPARVPMGSFFFVGGELLDYPGDPLGSGFNIVNCRCFTMYHTNVVQRNIFR